MSGTLFAFCHRKRKARSCHETSRGDAHHGAGRHSHIHAGDAQAAWRADKEAPFVFGLGCDGMPTRRYELAVYFLMPNHFLNKIFAQYFGIADIERRRLTPHA